MADGEAEVTRSAAAQKQRWTGWDDGGMRKFHIQIEYFYDTDILPQDDTSPSISSSENITRPRYQSNFSQRRRG